ncbi:protein tramtrack, beta isoform isoform X1 [Nilaparvata lugens]|uniref:protein tramtrack, beta isoform isoform X1 n=1 Tax=Nilaparvata lugens TaxID=108931 RepID=UPI00193D99E7|nr:protein tramtrack, beta isoform isoform X1 [Nilaparvata lugens]XP_039279495.1 protein tramtrack, beta isoform isoform X1 [Nilaparvata lugens]XP_039279496.1 protein tramtrack, beta isoform isoform X1 [Nilaparvata lugens]
MGTTQQFSLRWNNYLRHIKGAFDALRTDGDLVDVTLSCEGQKIRAHKMLLSACSTYFRDLFKENPCQHPVIIFKDVKFVDLKALIDFIYQGEVNVVQDQLSSFLLTAELLAVQGLSDGSNKDGPETSNTMKEPFDLSPPQEQQQQQQQASSDGSDRSGSPPHSPPAVKKQRRCSDVTSPASSVISDSASVGEHSVTEKQCSPTLSDRLLSAPDRNRNSSEPVSVPCRKPDSIRPVDLIKVEMPDYLDQDSVQLCGGGGGGDGVTSDIGVENLSRRDSTPYLPTHNSQDDHRGLNSYLDISRVMGLCGPSSALCPRDLTQELNSMPSLRLSDRFPCKYCDRTFNTLPILERHIAARHQLQEEMFFCSVCARYFKTKWSLSTHNSRYHKAKLPLRNRNETAESSCFQMQRQVEAVQQKT